MDGLLSSNQTTGIVFGEEHFGFFLSGGVDVISNASSVSVNYSNHQIKIKIKKSLQNFKISIYSTYGIKCLH